MSEPNELALGWASATLSEICQRIVDGSHIPPAARPTGLPMLSAKNINNRQIDFNGRLIPPDAFAVEDQRTQVRPGDVLLTIVGSIGRAAVVPNGIQPFTLQRSVAVLKPLLVDPRFLMYQLEARHVQYQLEAHARGTAQKGIYLKQLGLIQVRVAPLRQQAGIADLLDELLSDLDAGVAALQRAKTKLAHYRASVLKAAVEGALTVEWRKQHPDVEPAPVLLERILEERRRRWEEEQIRKFAAAGKEPPNDWKAKYDEPASPDIRNLPSLPEGWHWAGVGQLAATEKNAITDGPFGSALKTEHYTNIGPRVIRLQNIKDCVFADARAYISQDRYDSLSKHRVAAGDILIAALGENAPRACIAPESLGPAIVKADCIKFRVHGSVSARCIMYFLNAIPTRLRTKNTVHGVGRPRLNLSEIKSVALPLPPSSEQLQLVEAIEDQFSIIEHIEADIEAKLASAQVLRQSILRHAFTGQLVPQDPTDEPASELLKRIAAAREDRARQVSATKTARERLARFQEA